MTIHRQGFYHNPEPCNQPASQTPGPSPELDRSKKKKEAIDRPIYPSITEKKATPLSLTVKSQLTTSIIIISIDRPTAPLKTVPQLPKERLIDRSINRSLCSWGKGEKAASRNYASRISIMHPPIHTHTYRPTDRPTDRPTAPILCYAMLCYSHTTGFLCPLGETVTRKSTGRTNQ